MSHAEVEVDIQAANVAEERQRSLHLLPEELGSLWQSVGLAESALGGGWIGRGCGTGVVEDGRAWSVWPPGDSATGRGGAGCKGGAS